MSSGAAAAGAGAQGACERLLLGVWDVRAREKSWWTCSALPGLSEDSGRPCFHRFRTTSCMDGLALHDQAGNCSVGVQDVDLRAGARTFPYGSN